MRKRLRNVVKYLAVIVMTLLTVLYTALSITAMECEGGLYYLLGDPDEANAVHEHVLDIVESVGHDLRVCLGFEEE